MMKSEIEIALKKTKRKYQSTRFKEEVISMTIIASISSKSLKILIKFYDDKNASFKSLKQIKILQLIMNRKMNILMILSIDDGKCLIFFLLTLIELGMMIMVIHFVDHSDVRSQESMCQDEN